LTAAFRQHAPEFDFNGDRRASDGDDARNGFHKVALADRFLEIDPIDRSGYYGLMRGAHRRDRRDDVHHRDCFSAEERSIMVHVGGKDDLGAFFDYWFGARHCDEGSS